MLLASSLALGGCDVGPPAVDANAGDGPADRSQFADTVIAYTNSEGRVESCTDVRGCDPEGPCTKHPSLGMPDSNHYALPRDGRLEVAFLCSSIRDRPGSDPAADFQIVGTVPDGSRATVSLSLNGSSYAEIDFLAPGKREFDMSRASSLSVARFVRIAHQQGDPIAIDAVEAFR